MCESALKVPGGGGVVEDTNNHYHSSLSWVESNWVESWSKIIMWSECPEINNKQNIPLKMFLEKLEIVTLRSHSGKYWCTKHVSIQNLEINQFNLATNLVKLLSLHLMIIYFANNLQEGDKRSFWVGGSIG